MVNPDHSLLGSILHPQAKFGDMWRSAMIDAQSAYVDHHPRRSHRAMVIDSHPRSLCLRFDPLTSPSFQRGIVSYLSYEHGRCVAYSSELAAFTQNARRLLRRGSEKESHRQIWSASDKELSQPHKFCTLSAGTPQIEINRMSSLPRACQSSENAGWRALHTPKKNRSR